MLISELSEMLEAVVFNPIDDKEISVCYVGDLLGSVMINAPQNCVWFTVMNNVNVCAVASLINAEAVVLCENVKPTSELLQKASELNLSLIGTKLDAFNAIKSFVVSNENAKSKK